MTVEIAYGSHDLDPPEAASERRITVIQRADE